MFLILFPLPIKFCSVSIVHPSFSVFFIIQKLPIIHASIGPLKYPLTLDLILNSTPRKLSAVLPKESAFPHHIAFHKISGVRRAIVENKDAFSMSAIIFIFPRVFILVGPCFGSFPAFLVFFSLADVDVAFSAV